MDEKQLAESSVSAGEPEEKKGRLRAFLSKKFNKSGFKLTKEERNWTMYDAGNSAIYMFLILIGVSIPELAHGVPYFGDHADAAMSTFNAISGGLLAIMGPVLGAIADNKGRKKSMFRFFVILGVLGCYFSLFSNFGSLSNNPTAFFIPFVIFMMLILIGLGGSLLFYDSMLADVTTEERSDRVSARGYANGYIYSLIPFLVCLLIYYFFMDPDYTTRTMGVDGYKMIRLAITVCLVISGSWWLFWTRPLMKTFIQKTGVEPVKHQVRDAFKKLGITFSELKKYKHAFLFMIAFFFYINGVNTIIALSATYARVVLDVTQPQYSGSLSIYLIIALIMTQVVACVFAIIFGNLSKRVGARNLILISVVGYCVFVGYGVFMRTLFDFFILAFGCGIFLGGIQALSRSYFSRLAPIEKQSEFFGLYDIFNKSSNFLGSALYTVISGSLYASNFNFVRVGVYQLGVPQISVACLSIFFIVGLIILFFIPNNRADKVKQV
jgi:Permeases of the major facilitator superfamily